MGKKWKKLRLTRKVAKAKKAAQEVVEETNKTTKKATKKKIRWPWGKKKGN